VSQTEDQRLTYMLIDDLSGSSSDKILLVGVKRKCVLHVLTINGGGTVLQAGRSRVLFPMRSLDFSIDLILPAALWPWGLLSL
jgi:hypothetical protein